MLELHSGAAYLVAALALATLAVSGAAAALGPPMRIWLDRAILVALIALALAALTGLPLLLTALPADPLHLLYGALAPALLLAGRFLGGRRSLRARGILVAMATLAVLGVIYRLFTTS